MRPIASDQSPKNVVLTDVFASRGHVKLLRVLSTEAEGSVASPEVAARTGMTPSGARKALRRLTRAGILEKVGSGKSTRYALSRNGELAHEIVRLFELERKTLDPGWRRVKNEDSPVSAGDRGAEDVSHGRRRTHGNGKGNAPEKRHVVNPASPEFHSALVSMLEEDLSLIRRAREKVLEKLEHREPGNGHDLWEWRKILDTYPLPRLLNFLESESPRAARLRKSSPFPEVMSKREQERLGEHVELAH